MEHSAVTCPFIQHLRQVTFLRNLQSSLPCDPAMDGMYFLQNSQFSFSDIFAYKHYSMRPPNSIFMVD